MKEFSNLKRQIDFDKYESPNLDLTSHRNYVNKNYVSCGSAAIGLLMNKNPLLLDKVCKNAKIGWFTTQVIQYLKSKKYTVITLSKNDVLHKWDHGRMPITRNHVLLINSRVNKNENSMYVVHNNMVWHNYNEETVDPLFFINKPTQDVLLIHHPTWSFTKRKSNPNPNYKYPYVNLYKSTG